MSSHSKSSRKRGASQVPPITDDANRTDFSSHLSKKRAEVEMKSPTPSPAATSDIVKTETSGSKPIEISTGSAPTVVSVNSSSTEQTKEPATNADAKTAPISIGSSSQNDKKKDEETPVTDEDDDDSDCLTESEICCACCGITDEMMEDETVEHIVAFRELDEDKHQVEVNLAPLTGPENWKSWSLGIRIVLRVHRVGVFVDNNAHFAPLDPDHDLHVWSERMLDIAIAVIYANVSQRVRDNLCFMHSIWSRDPNRVMSSLATHFGSGAVLDDEDFDDDLHDH